jgi:HEPN domain-containing protein
MKDPKGEAERWPAQSRYDLDAARYDAAGGFWAHACFNAQQAAEKACKALLYGSGQRIVLGHSVAELTKECAAIAPEMQALASDAAAVDRYYIPTRYPNGLPGGVPAESFFESDAQDAIAIAERIVQIVTREVEGSTK